MKIRDTTPCFSDVWDAECVCEYVSAYVGVVWGKRVESGAHARVWVAYFQDWVVWDEGEGGYPVRKNKVRGEFIVLKEKLGERKCWDSRRIHHAKYLNCSSLHYSLKDVNNVENITHTYSVWKFFSSLFKLYDVCTE